MEQNKMYREDFWNISGNAEEEMKECIKNAERKNNAALSILDAWHTLICC